MLFATLLLGVLGAKIPTDSEIEARLTATIREALHPDYVKVDVTRSSPLSTTFQRVDITISGFSADSLPFALPDAAPADVPAAAPAPDAAKVAPSTAPAAPAPRRAGKQIRLRLANVRCTDFTLNHVRVQQLELTATEMYLPLQAILHGQFQITAAASVTGTVQLRQDDLTAYLSTRELPITHPTLTLAPDACRLKGNSRTLIPMPIQLSGTLAARDGAVLYLDNPRLRVSVIPVPGIIADRVLRDLNPLGDLNAEFKLPAPLRITRTTMQEGMLILEGALLFPAPEP